MKAEVIISGSGAKWESFSTCKVLVFPFNHKMFFVDQIYFWLHQIPENVKMFHARTDAV